MSVNLLINQMISKVPILKHEKIVNNDNQYRHFRNYCINFFIGNSYFYYKNENRKTSKTLIKGLYSIYWYEKKAFVFYQPPNSNIIYLNKSLKKLLNWEITVKNVYYKKTVEWITTEEFEKFIICNIKNLKFKNIKEKQKSLDLFKDWLKTKNNND